MAGTIFGGLETFGLVGLFLGPVIMAALLTIWREWVPVSPPEILTADPGPTGGERPGAGPARSRFDDRA